MPREVKISNNHHFSTSLLHKPPCATARGNAAGQCFWPITKKMRPLLEQPPPVFFDNLLTKEFAKVAVHIEQVSLFAYHLTHKKPIFVCDYLGLYFVVDVFHRHYRLII